MIFYASAIIFLILTFVSLRVKRTWFQPGVMLFYSLTSLIMAFIQTSEWTPMYMIRYFFYVISGFVVIVIPLFLLLISLITFTEMMRNRPHTIGFYVKNMVISITLLGLIIFIMGSAWRLESFYSALFMNMMVLLSLYFIALFVAYGLLNLLVHLWPMRQKPNVIVILGQQIDDEQHLPHVLKYRLDYAIDYFASRPVEDQVNLRIIVTGGNAQDGKRSEAESMRHYLMEHGIQSRNIILETKAQNTRDNFLHSAAKIKEYNLSGHVLVITSNFHLMRSYYYAWESKFPVRFKGAGTPIWILPYYLVRDFLAYIIASREITYLYLIFLIIVSIWQGVGG